MGQEFVTPLNDDLTFAQNLVEQMSGDTNLISIRSRGAVARPFQVIRRMQAEAQQEYQDRINALEDELAEAQRKINELQREKSSDQRFIMTPEQKEAIERFREQEASTKKELKQVRKQLRRKVDALQTGVKLANIALMPALVGIAGIVLAVVKRRRKTSK